MNNPSKKFLTVLIIVVLLVVIGWAVYYLWKNYGGAIPALKKPAENIADVIPETPAKPGQNFTGIPLALPNGFSISIFAKDLTNPRVIAEDPNGVLAVSIPSQRKVVVLPDKNNSGKTDGVVTIADDLNNPHGIVFDCNNSLCKLYVAENDKVTVFDYDKDSFKASNGKKILDLPSGGAHVTRTILLMPSPNNDKMLVSIGSSCNVCAEDDSRRAAIIIADKDGTNSRIYASGLRNSVFMAIHHLTGEVWATDNGRDLLGDDIPPDEINIIKDGLFYGWPFCYGNKVQDASFNSSAKAKQICGNSEPPHINIPAHSAPLGLAFITGSGWPKEYQDDLLVSYHGSWNRSVPAGDKIVRFKLDDKGNLLGSEDFITGWLKDDGYLGRPVGLLVKPDGLVYVSDDKAGVIYRIKYNQ